MDYYINITVLPDTEFPIAVLLNAIYAKCHKRLHDLAATDIGVSFPKAEQTLGTLLRLHGTQERLQKLMAENWLGGMSGYCEISPITAIPQKVTFRIVSRKQDTMSQSKLKRLIKRGTIAKDQISTYRAKMHLKNCNYPYVEQKSSSNGQKHRRYIEQGTLREQPTQGSFDQFGLSKTATIPWFV